jgi:hypothetical protein
MRQGTVEPTFKIDCFDLDFKFKFIIEATLASSINPKDIKATNYNVKGLPKNPSFNLIFS